MKKKFWMLVVALVLFLACTFVFSTAILAEEKTEFPELSIASVRAGPVDVPGYIGAQVDFWAEVVAGLLRTGKPFAAFGDETFFGLEVTAKEGLIWDKLDLVTGFTFKNEERGKFQIGLQYIGLVPFEGGIWEIFKRCDLTAYLIEGDWYFGVGYDLIGSE